MKIILLGPPGAGKGTQAQFISEQFSIPIISTGGMLRAAMKTGNELGLRVKATVNAGKLVDDVTMIALIHERVVQSDCANGFLLDGFPRTIPQAEALRDATIQIDYVVEIRVPDEEIVKRLSGRRTHLNSGRVYHVVFHPPKTPDQDDVTGELLVQRDDDKEETVRKRLAVYHEQTSPLIGFYRDFMESAPDQAPKLISIDGMFSVEMVREALLKALH